MGIMHRDCRGCGDEFQTRLDIRHLCAKCFAGVEKYIGHGEHDQMAREYIDTIRADIEECDPAAIKRRIRAQSKRLAAVRLGMKSHR